MGVVDHFRKFQGCHLGLPELCQNAISRTVRAINLIQLCGGPVGQRDSKEQEKSISGLPGLPLQKNVKKCHLGLPELCQNAISRTVRAIKKI